MTKVLVSYFSASGVTAKLAEDLAKAIGADVFEIEPEEKYTDADLDWRDKTSRSSVEMSDRSSRPAIKTLVEDISKYDTIFVGFPIWWYREPSIIDTFLEAYDLSGKTLIPFATSGSSGLGESSDNFKALAPSAVIKEGKRFPSNASEADLKAWAEQFI
ncbi:MAG: NAD(P)H-dependent oxidoreductase [Clostridiales bacterium]|nr:NAD(P)H-dependent oxidoreductase [Clostridiales bacterium]